MREVYKTTIFYGVSSALNKGAMLFMLPLMGSLLSVENYGVWSLFQVIISISSVLLSLNGGASILREGVENKLLGRKIFNNYSIFLFIFSGLSLTILTLTNLKPLYFFLICLILSESFFVIVLSLLRSRDNHYLYFLLSLCKLFSLIGAYFICIKLGKSDLTSVLKNQFWFLLAFIVLVYIILTTTNKSSSSKLKVNRQVYMFGLILIPHSFSQWVISGSDRVIIERYLSLNDLGLYSLAYSMAMVLLILNTGLGLALPNYIFKNYKKWIASNQRLTGIIIFSFLSFIIFYGLRIGVEYLDLFIHKDVNNSRIKLNMSIIVVALYLLGVYTFYVNILFYKKKSKVISIITTAIAILNIILTIYFVRFWGLEGASFATLVSYFIYLLGIMYFACFYEKEIPNSFLKKESLVIITSSLIMIFSI